eukprot:TRINITY_DN4822_c0_g2_i1.p1 TRINITY_DN4822_c0_g2~~TRINITY_DN4822_c0_g2_i1.p1  ORF type:complete len:190 (-),score=10.34 TRINITY_DN4822_c0_g2_i1:300-869(-)
MTPAELAGLQRATGGLSAIVVLEWVLPAVCDVRVVHAALLRGALDERAAALDLMLFDLDTSVAPVYDPRDVGRAAAEFLTDTEIDTRPNTPAALAPQLANGTAPPLGVHPLPRTNAQQVCAEAPAVHKKDIEAVGLLRKRHTYMGVQECDMLHILHAASNRTSYCCACRRYPLPSVHIPHNSARRLRWA